MQLYDCPRLSNACPDSAATAAKTHPTTHTPLPDRSHIPSRNGPDVRTRNPRIPSPVPNEHPKKHCIKMFGFVATPVYRQHPNGSSSDCLRRHLPCASANGCLGELGAYRALPMRATRVAPTAWSVGPFLSPLQLGSSRVLKGPPCAVVVGHFCEHIDHICVRVRVCMCVFIRWLLACGLMVKGRRRDSLQPASGRVRMDPEQPCVPKITRCMKPESV